MSSEIKIVWPAPGQFITAPSGIEYTIGTLLDSGGYALVFEGVDSFGNHVVLKIYKPAERPFEEVQEQWKRETAFFERLRHPNVVAIYDAFVCENLFYIVLERAWGSVGKWVNADQPPAELAVREMARQLLFGLHFIHNHGVLHRDVTIHNCLVFDGPVNSGGVIYKISDFGISKEFFEPWAERVAHTRIAHPIYMPPELLLPNYGYTNERTDLYHLGLILLFAYTGSLPFNESMTEDEIAEIVTNGGPRLTAEAIGTPFGDFIAVLLRRSNEYRYSSALEAWNQLREI